MEKEDKIMIMLSMIMAKIGITPEEVDEVLKNNVVSNGVDTDE